MQRSFSATGLIDDTIARIADSSSTNAISNSSAAHNETPSVVTGRVYNPDRSRFAIER